MNNYQQLRSDLIKLAEEIKELENKAINTYNRHPKDILDLGESQGYNSCHKKILKLLEKYKDDIIE